LQEAARVSLTAATSAAEACRHAVVTRLRRVYRPLGGPRS
jgi:hypothetical protein